MIPMTKENIRRTQKTNRVCYPKQFVRIWFFTVSTKLPKHRLLLFLTISVIIFWAYEKNRVTLLSDAIVYADIT